MPATQNDAFIDFADRYRGRLLSTARRFLRDAPAAQDVVQDAMLLAVRNLPQFRGDSQMSTWLGRIVINASLTRQRVARRRPEQSLDTLLEQAERGEQRRYRAAIVTHAPGPERELLNEELRSLLREAIDALRWDLPHGGDPAPLRGRQHRRNRRVPADHAKRRETPADSCPPGAAPPPGPARLRSAGASGASPPARAGTTGAGVFNR